MQYLFSKKSVLSIIVLLVIGLLAVFILQKETQAPTEESQDVIQEVRDPKIEILGSSVEERKIESYTFGTGAKHLLFVGGIHGGYEWNSVVLAYKFIDYFTENPSNVPDSLTVTIIPSANPDGVFKVIEKEGRFTVEEALIKDPADGTGRFNAHNVDLNRNFDCKWQPESTWRNKTVSAGTHAFSEPEAQAIRNFVQKNSPSAVVFFHSQSNAVYASECINGILPQTRAIMNAYSKASGYKAIDSFDAYPVTGDAEGWLASIGIPAITVELQTHTTIEWEKNLAGTKALLEYYK